MNELILSMWDLEGPGKDTDLSWMSFLTQLRPDSQQTPKTADLKRRGSDLQRVRRVD
jgi:hypothetical protein